MSNTVNQTEFINYISEFKKILVTRGNTPVTQIFKIDSNISDEYYFQILNKNNQIVSLSGRSFQIYGSIEDVKKNTHILFYTPSGTVEDDVLHFHINTYNQQYLSQINSNKQANITIVETTGGDTQVVLRDVCLCYKRPYLDNVVPAEVYTVRILTGSLPWQNEFGAGSNINLIEGTPNYAFGSNLSTASNQFVIGSDNTPDATKAFIVANSGNIFTVDYEGNVEAKSLTIDGEQVATSNSIPTGTAQLTNDANFATEDWVEAKGYITGYVDTTYTAGQGLKLEDGQFSLTAQIPSIKGLATEQYVDAAVSGKADLSSVYTKQNVYTYLETDQKILEATSGKADKSELTAYALSSDLALSTANLNYQISQLALDIPTKVTDLTDAGNYALKSEIPVTTGFATKEEVAAVDNKFSGYATTDTVNGIDARLTAVENAGYITDSALEPYAKTSAVAETYVTKNEISDFITESAITGLATKQEATYTGSGAVSVENNVISLTGELGKNYYADETTLQLDTTTNTFSIKSLATKLGAGDGISLSTNTNGILIITNIGEGSGGGSGYQYYADNESILLNGFTFSVNESWLTGKINSQTSGLQNLSAGTGLQIVDNIISVSASYLSSNALEGYATQDWVEQNFLTGTTTIPTKVSDLTNDLVFVTSAQLTGALNDYTPTNDLADYISDNILTGYVTTEQLEEQSFATTGLVDSVSTTLNNSITGKANTADLTAYQLKSEVITYTAGDGLKLQNNEFSLTAAIPSIDGLATTGYVQEQVSGKADKSEIAQMATTGYVDSTISSKADKSELEAVSGELVNAIGANQTAINEVSGVVDTKTTSAQVTDIITSYVGENLSAVSQLVNDSQFITLASIPEIPSIEGLATVEQVSTASSTLTTQVNYVSSVVSTLPTENTTYTAGTGLKLSGTKFILTAQIPSIQGLANEGYVDSSIEDLSTTISSDYAKKTDIVTYTGTNGIKVDNGVISVSAEYLTSTDLIGYATENWVENNALSDYAKKSEIPQGVTWTGLSGVAVSNENSQIYLTGTILSGSDTITINSNQISLTDASNYVKAGDNVSRLANDVGYLTAHQSLEGYATEQWVESKNYLTGVDLTDYATTGFVTDYCSAFITAEDIPAQTEYTAGEGLKLQNNEFSLTAAIPSVEGLVSASQVSSIVEDMSAAIVDGYATESFVTSQGYITGITDNALLSDIKTYTAGQGLKLEGTEFSLTAAIPTSTSQLTNDSNFISSIVLEGYDLYGDFVSVSATQLNIGSNWFTLDETANLDFKGMHIYGDDEFWADQLDFDTSVFSVTEGSENSVYISLATPIPTSSDISGIASAVTTGIVTVDYITGTLGITGGSNYTAGEGIAINNNVISMTAAIPTDVSDLTNDVGYITSDDLSELTLSDFQNDVGYITEDDISGFTTSAQVSAIASAYASEATPSVDTICGMLSSANENLTITKSDNKILFTATGGGGGSVNLSGGPGIKISQVGDVTLISIATAVITAPESAAYNFDFRNPTTSSLLYTSYNGASAPTVTISGTLPNGITTTSIPSGIQFVATSGADVSNGTTNVNVVFDSMEVFTPAIVPVEIKTVGRVSATITATSAEYTFDGSVAGDVTSAFNYYYDGSEELTVEVENLPTGISATNSFNPSTGSGTITFTGNSENYVAAATLTSDIIFSANDLALNTSKQVVITLQNVEVPITQATPFTIKSNGDTTVTFTKVSSPYDASLDYSVNGGTWNAYTWGTGINLTDGQFVSFSGANSTFSKSSDAFYKVQTTGNGTIEAYGNVDSLINWTTDLTNTISNTFNGLLIRNSKLVSVKKLLLPATTLVANCYANMFNYWDWSAGVAYGNLTAAMSELPALSATGSSYSMQYNNMFAGQKQLTQAPHIKLLSGDHVMLGMFKNCYNLSSIEVDFTDWVICNGTDSNNDNGWMIGVQTNSGTFTKPAALSTIFGKNIIPTNWTVVNK